MVAIFIYDGPRAHKTPTLRRSRGATGTRPPLVLRLFRAASNHHESPFRIGAEPRGKTNARGGFSSGCRGFFFLGRQSDWTVSGRRSLHGAQGSAPRIYFRWKDNFHSSGGIKRNGSFLRWARRSQPVSLSWIFDHSCLFRTLCVSCVLRVHYDDNWNEYKALYKESCMRLNDK